MSDISDILAEASNPDYVRTTTARVLLRQDLLTLHDELEAELAAAVKDDAMRNEVPTAPAISRRLVDLEAEIDNARREFRFKSIGHRAWADLMAEHPPTKDQLKQFPRIDHNPETFPVAAIAACCVSPKMTLEQAQELERGRWNEEEKEFEGGLNDTQFNELLVRCVEANTGGLNTPKSAAAGAILRLNGQYANTPAPAASPAPSSSAA